MRRGLDTTRRWTTLKSLDDNPESLHNVLTNFLSVPNTVVWTCKKQVYDYRQSDLTQHITLVAEGETV
jgi:hypothetical protein